MAATFFSTHLIVWAVLVFSLLSVFRKVAAFNATYLQGCDKSNNLTQLWLNRSGLSGPIPPEVGKCTALQVLSLRNNPQVNGTIPPEIGQLTNLITLDLGITGLTGPIPVEIGNLSSLQTLKLGLSSVRGPVPWDTLCQLPNLSLLWLNHTKIEGPITRDIGKCAALQGLSMYNTSKVNGSIPAEIGQLSKLTFLDLGYANLSGPIPEEIGRLSSLATLDLEHNNLTAPVPWEALCQLANISSLNLGSNPQLVGPSPPSCMWNLTSLQSLTLASSPVFAGGALPSESCQLVKLQELLLGATNLTGPIPACLGNIAGLSQLSLFQNALDGGIPPGLGLLRNLSSLELQKNRLMGNIPVEFGGLTRLTWLDAHDNNLSGPLLPRVFASLGQLLYLDLSNNTFTGAIPTEIGASGEELTWLDLAHNNLSGAIPPGLGNLSNMTHLDLSYNELSGELPAELKGLRPSMLSSINLACNNLTGGVGHIGHLTGLSILILNNNNYSGPIPTAWFDSTGLQTLYLSFNSFSGPIPSAIQNMRPPDYSSVIAELLSRNAPASTLSIVIDLLGSVNIVLNSNQLSGSFPNIDGLKIPALINVSDNNLSGTFRAGPFKMKNLTPSFLELSNNGPLELLPGYNLSGLAMVSLPNISSEGTPLVAPDIRALNIAGRGNTPSKKLDLARVPATCPYVSYAHGSVTDITFWDACDKSLGCVVNLIGTGSKLSRAARRKVCLGKISVFLEGDSPAVNFPVGAGPRSASLVNRQGSIYFNDTAFIDDIDLGPGGVAYTGVDFARVQQGNLCRNERAAEVVGITYGVFSALILVSAVAWYCASIWGVLGKGDGSKLSPRVASAMNAGLYFWGIASILLSWGDLVSDVHVVVEIWGVWSAWVILGLILAPFVLSGLCAGRVLLEGFDLWAPWKARFKWIPFYKLPEPSDPPPLGALPLWKYAFIPIALPVTVGYVVILDALDLLDKTGAHLRIGPDVYSLRAYSDFRLQLDLTLRSIPQAVFQTALYLLGSSRATRIYVDEQILLQSIVLSLLNVLVKFNFLVHECLTTRASLWSILQRRFAARNCCGTPLRAVVIDEEAVDELVVAKVGEPST